MGLFSEFKKGFTSGKDDSLTEKETKNNQRLIKLIEPNKGRIVTLQVFAEEPVLQMFINLITAIDGYNDTKASISGNIVTFTFPNDSIAELFRSSWRD